MNEFNAKWISNDEFEKLSPVNVFHREMEKFELDSPVKPENRHILFRKKINIRKSGRYVVRVSADDYYKLYINGSFVTQGPAPAYNFHYYYNEIDVTDFICDGENTIAAHTYYQGLINRVWVSADLRFGFIFDLSENGKVILESGTDWKTHSHTAFSSSSKIGYDTAFAETYDAGCAETGFEKCDFDDSAWEYAKLKQNTDYTLFPQPTKQLEIYDVKPASTVKTDNGYIFDFGFEAVGYVKFSAKGNKGDKITILCGEELNDDGTVRYKMRCNCDYIEYMILSGKTDVLNQYDYKAFRYLQLIIPDGAEVDLSSVCFTVRHYPFKEIKHYTGKNETLAKIYKLCSDTIKYGVQECFVDCPSREKGQYLGDVSIAGIASMVLTGDASMIKKALTNYAQSSFIDKGIMTVAPSSLMQEIADYSLQFPMQVLYVYRYTKDIDFLKQMYPYVMNVYDYFLAYRRENGLIDNVKEKWNLVDWPANLRDNYDFKLDKPIGEGFFNVINAFYCGMLSDVDEIRNILGIEPCGIKEQTYKAFIDAFYDKEQHLFVDSIGSKHTSYHANILPLLFDIGITKENKRSILKLIEEKGVTCGGTYMAFFALWGLKKNGETQLMEKLIASDSAWANMLSEGATTCYEAWGKNQKWNTSLFHPWSSCPAILLD